jgi:hypothetical protein
MKPMGAAVPTNPNWETKMPIKDIIGDILGAVALFAIPCLVLLVSHGLGA